MVAKRGAAPGRRWPVDRAHRGTVVPQCREVQRPEFSSTALLVSCKRRHPASTSKVHAHLNLPGATLSSKRGPVVPPFRPPALSTVGVTRRPLTFTFTFTRSRRLKPQARVPLLLASSSVLSSRRSTSLCSVRCEYIDGQQLSLTGKASSSRQWVARPRSQRQQ